MATDKSQNPLGDGTPEEKSVAETMMRFAERVEEWWAAEGVKHSPFEFEAEDGSWTDQDNDGFIDAESGDKLEWKWYEGWITIHGDTEECLRAKWVMEQVMDDEEQVFVDIPERLRADDHGIYFKVTVVPA